MKLVVLYRPRSEGSSAVESFVRDFKLRYRDSNVAVLDVDGRDGRAMADLYAIMDYPTILALRDDGSLLKSWEGMSLPLMDEVAYYALP